MLLLIICQQIQILVKLKYIKQFNQLEFLVLGLIAKKALTNIPIPLARDNLPGLVSNLTSNAMNKFERKMSGKELSDQEKDLLHLFQMKI